MRGRIRALAELAAATPPAAGCVIAWLTVTGGERALHFAAAGAIGIVLGGLWTRGRVVRVAGVVCGLLAFCALVGVRPDHLLRVVRAGLRDASAVRSPFDAGLHEPLTAVVLLAVIGFCWLCVSLVRAGRPLAAGAAAIVGIAWPATLVGADESTWAVVAVGAGLWPVLVPRLRAPRTALAGLATLALVGVGVAGAGAAGLRPDAARVDWRGWNPLGTSGRQVSVRYIWDANYGGVQFPSRPTVVLRVKAPQRASYWRASTLDLFTDDRWIENLAPVGIASGDIRLPVDRLLPPIAAREKQWFEHEVTVVGLADGRVVAAAQPMGIEAEPLGRVFMLSGGVLFATDGVKPGTTYKVWSYVAQPKPAALVRARPDYPVSLGRYLDLGRLRLPAFGSRGREERLRTVFADPQFPDLEPYAGVWREARRLTQGTTSPYLATLAIERWLRTGGGYTYDERPAPPPLSVPPLVDFTLGQKTGYCQHFAGSMALMLRLLGIPARVAVGFTSGRRLRGEWVVTDHQAHAWVEAWFAGYGWLPFDPTPGRGRFATAYSFASDSADAVQALGTGRFLDFSPQPTGPAVEPPITTSATDPGRGAGGGGRPWLVPLLASVSAPVLVAVGVAWLKRRTRRRRLGRTDPRARAEGILAELADCARDRGVAVPPDSGLPAVQSALERAFGLRLDRLGTALVTARFAPLPLALPAADEALTEVAKLDRLLARRSGIVRTLVARLRPRQGWFRGRRLPGR